MCRAQATLAVSVLSVSLYSVKTSDGFMSEQSLLMAFVRADEDHSGSLDKHEALEAVRKLGIPPTISEKLRSALERTADVVTLPMWYDLIGQVYRARPAFRRRVDVSRERASVFFDRRTSRTFFRSTRRERPS